jgi:hypothetical protein
MTNERIEEIARSVFFFQTERFPDDSIESVVIVPNYLR